MAKTKIQVRRKAVEARINGIELAKQRLVAFRWCVGALEKDRMVKPQVKEAIETIWFALTEKELDAYRNLFMMAIILPDDLLDKAKEEIMRHFIAEGKGIMHYLDVNCEQPNTFYGADRDTFRELLIESLTENEAE